MSYEYIERIVNEFGFTRLIEDAIFDELRKARRIAILVMGMEEQSNIMLTTIQEVEREVRLVPYTSDGADDAEMLYSIRHRIMDLIISMARD